jgi:galactosylceramidase
VNPTIWATAHLTQFTKVGWKYLKAGAGSGDLPHGGYYTTLVDPAGEDWTMNIVKVRP